MLLKIFIVEGKEVFLMKKFVLCAAMALALLSSCGVGNGGTATKTNKLKGAYDNAVSVNGSSASACLTLSDSALMGDTNPYDIDDYYNATYTAVVQGVNTYLGLDSSIWSEMIQTRALDGRVSEESNGYKVSWTYHPDQGLQVTWRVA
ncbi:MAG: hypothetical protein BWZ03_00528 [bacterium ADurb.BinA186]|jgi:hypothetical protein|nr:MAG: hypothetical protein BWZ03_00528 [bacterium ADurb.BinA186]